MTVVVPLGEPHRPPVREAQPPERVWLLDGPDRGAHLLLSSPPPRMALSQVEEEELVEHHVEETAIGEVEVERRRPTVLHWYERIRFARTRERGEVWAYQYAGPGPA